MTDDDDIEIAFLEQVSRAALPAELEDSGRRQKRKEEWLRAHRENVRRSLFDEAVTSEHRRIERDMIAAAKCALTDPLKSAGASQKRISQACREIGFWLAFYSLVKDREVDPFGEIEELRKTLSHLEQQMNSLSDDGRAYLGSMFSDGQQAELEPFLSEETLEPEHSKSPTWGVLLESPTDRFCRVLPRLLSRLDPPPRKRGAHDQYTTMVIKYACIEWREATGVLPTGTINDEGWPTAALYLFLQTHVDGASPATWSRILQKLRDTSDDQDDDAGEYQ
jgi:hypothetical protein